MKTLNESFRNKFIEDIFIEFDRDYPTHIPVGIMIEIVFEASKKVGGSVNQFCKYESGYNSQWFKQSLKERKENYTHEEEFIKEGEKSH